jgi:hypothetical protein
MSPEAIAKMNVLRSAPLDSWIALSADELHILAVGKSYQEVADILTATGEKDAIVDITPSSWDDLMCASAL